MRTGLVQHPAGNVPNRAPPIVERKVREADAAIADAAKDQLALDGLVLLGRDGNETAVLLLQPVTDELDGLDLRLAVDGDRRMEEQEADHERLAGRLALGEVAQHLQVSPGVGVVFFRVLELDRIDADVGPRQLTHLLQLLRRPGRLRRTAAPDDHDLPQGRDTDRLDSRLRGVGRRELLGCEREHARHVERNVPIPDHDSALHVQVEHEVLEIGMAVVPGDELGGRPRAAQVFAGNSETTVALRAERVDDRVVEADQVFVREVPSDLDVAEESEARFGCDSFEGTRNRLQLRVIGRHTEAHEPPRRRQPLDHVHLERHVGVEQGACRIETRRPRADDRNSQRRSACRHARHANGGCFGSSGGVTTQLVTAA